MSSNEKVWFITGASSGFGREIAKKLLEKGKIVVATARNPMDLNDLVRGYEGKALALKLDVTKRSEAEAAVKQAEDHFGSIDFLVNNAGYGYIGAIEEGEEAEVREMFDVNFFGAARMVHLILPGMRKRKSGLIINMSSIAGLAGFGGLGYYSATKFALEGFSEALRMEVEPLGIQVMAVEPSGFRTDFAGRSLQDAHNRIKDYEQSAHSVQKMIHDYDGNQAGDPKRAAEAIIEAAESSNPPSNLILGEDAYKRSAQKFQNMVKLTENQKKTAIWADNPK
ncbi:MAG: SDR family NAD(P)-dependent oxidoreductase [Chlamydiia bacterium]|nr:SDR family NAD(P)-dependent oxidoreductase [Chlamydiia bacterium]